MSTETVQRLLDFFSPERKCWLLAADSGLNDEGEANLQRREQLLGKIRDAETNEEYDRLWAERDGIPGFYTSPRNHIVELLTEDEIATLAMKLPGDVFGKLVRIFEQCSKAYDELHDRAMRGF